MSHSDLYQIFAWHIVDQIATGELRPIGNFTYSETLNAATSLSLTVQLDTDTNIIQPASHSVLVLRKGSLVWAGFVESMVPDIEGGTLTINCISWEGYLNRRVLDTTNDYYIADQTSEIAKDLIDEMQAVTNGDVGWLTDCPASGRTRTMDTIYFFEKRNLLALMDEISSLDDGFDWGIKKRWVNNAPELTFTTWYPKRGSRLGVKLGYLGEGNPGSNISPTRDGINTSQFAWKVHAIGANEGYLTPLTTLIDTPKASSYPLYESVRSYASLGNQSVLDDLAAEDLAYYSTISYAVNVDIRPGDPFAVPGAFQVGDEVEIYINEGWWQVNAVHRIISWSMTVQDDLESLSFTLELPT